MADEELEILKSYPLYGKNSNMPLYGTRHDRPLYGGLLANVNIFTQWEFEQYYDKNGEGSLNYFVTACINGNEVCYGHSPSHVIDYNIADLGSVVEWSDEERGYIMYFTMGIKKLEDYEIWPFGGPCIFRCWWEAEHEGEKNKVVCSQEGRMGDTKRFMLIYRPQNPKLDRVELRAA
jgi:hypothetical protein